MTCSHRLRQTRLQNGWPPRPDDWCRVKENGWPPPQNPEQVLTQSIFIAGIGFPFCLALKVMLAVYGWPPLYGWPPASQRRIVVRERIVAEASSKITIFGPLKQASQQDGGEGTMDKDFSTIMGQMLVLEEALDRCSRHVLSSHSICALGHMTHPLSRR